MGACSLPLAVVDRVRHEAPPSMGKYTPAAHQAARTVEQQSSLLDCLAPANAIVREFLL